MNATRQTQPAGTTIRKAAVAAFEALPALLLAAALLMPVIAALANRDAEPAAIEGVRVGQVIAAQGNQALADIRQDSRRSVRQNLGLPAL